MNCNAMISAIRHGVFWKYICHDNELNVAELQKIIYTLSMVCFGFCELWHRSEIYHHAMEKWEIVYQCFHRWHDKGV